MKARLSLTAQIQEIDRELALRAEVYPRMVASRKMRASEADHHILRLQAVRATLKWLQAHEDMIRQRCAEGRP